MVDQAVLLFAETRRHFHPMLDASLLASRFLPVVDELPLRQKGEERTSITRREVVDYLSSVGISRWETNSDDRPPTSTDRASV